MRYTSYFVPAFITLPSTENVDLTLASEKYLLSATNGDCPFAPVAANNSAGVGALDPCIKTTIHTPEFALLTVTLTLKLVCVTLVLAGVPPMKMGASTVVSDKGEETTDVF